MHCSRACRCRAQWRCEARALQVRRGVPEAAQVPLPAPRRQFGRVFIDGYVTCSASIAPCKFGASCTRRATCRYRHDDGDQAVGSLMLMAARQHLLQASSSPTLPVAPAPQLKADASAEDEIVTWLPHQLRIKARCRYCNGAGQCNTACR